VSHHPGHPLPKWTRGQVGRELLHWDLLRGYCAPAADSLSWFASVRVKSLGAIQWVRGTKG